MEYKRKKSKQYGDFVEIIFENEEEYQDLLEKYKNRIEYLEKCEYDSSSEKALVSSFERLKRVSNEGVITTAFFGNNCLDALYVATSGIYSNFYLRENNRLLKSINQKLEESDSISESIIKKYKLLDELRQNTNKMYQEIIKLLYSISLLNPDEKQIENSTIKSILSEVNEYIESGKMVDDLLEQSFRKMMEDKETVKIMKEAQDCIDDFERIIKEINEWNINNEEESE